MKEKFVYFFGGGKAQGGEKLRDLLGGKGAGLAEMTNIGIPVPPGFTISTQMCNLFYDRDMNLPQILMQEVRENLKKVEKLMGAKFGDLKNPLLLSVRSGAKFSMPGMMDTILNLGLNEETTEGLIQKTGNERFAYDSYRRFIQMFGSVVLGIDKNEFEKIIEKKKEHHRIKMDTSLMVSDLKDIISKFKKKIKSKTGEEFPQDPFLQLLMSIEAVFKSWNNPRAIHYRKLNQIPSDLGTAVNLQAMVFGNMGDDCLTGVGFTRNPSNGENLLFGEYLVNAQGEDVVAGIRTPKPLEKLKKERSEIYKKLLSLTKKLEKHYQDIQDFEFTVQQGKLFMLQTRRGKRTAHAAVKAAVDMVKEKLISKEEAIRRIEPAQLDQLLHPVIDPDAKLEVIARGLAASPGAASGKIVFSAEEAVKLAESGEDVIMVRKETNPDDISGMAVARGILTSRGGMTSHAAVVARGMGIPCVVGCEEIKVNEERKVFTVKGYILREKESISVNGTTGEVILGTAPTIKPALTGEFGEFMEWTDQIRKLGVRTNADVPKDAEQAIKFGAEGIGLCRTEHMFFAKDRLPLVREMILAKTREEREQALNKLLPFQKSDFKGLFEVMKGFPVTIRTLDPPLHEFLPKKEELLVEITELRMKNEEPEKLKEKEELLARVEELSEFNPMLGHRGCRLGIVYPEITEMQVKAIFEAACELAKKKKVVVPEVMIPLVGTLEEFVNQKEIVVRVAEETIKKYKVKLKYLVGTMIEIPRASLTADEIATEAEFFSFGTNDMTQMVYGYSRDDAGKFIRYYIEHGILSQDPFVSIDQKGVGQIVAMGVKKGKDSRKDLKVGICGEHGGDPESIIFCHKIGLDYVSCSPYRVPIARLAAAKAVVGTEDYTTA
ncbi:MAG: pyruvate phosphate dikinase [candidate division Zixibacteria bacterium SM23_73_2]|nr:MAG: pyruvate phosphate dikinase [candidate division Zixibacteria bacterium SM23_73_2]